MTNILFGTNYQCLAASIAATSTETGYSANNVIAGPRSNTWLSDAAAGEQTLTYTLTSAIAPNYYAVARADLAAGLVAANAGTLLQLQYSDDGASFSAYTINSGALTVASLTALSASGEDYLYYNAALTGSHLYYRLSLASQSGTAFAEVSKFYCGTAIDLGRDPDDIQIARIKTSETAVRPLYRITLHYTDIAYSAAMSAITNMFSIADYQNVFMFTSTYHNVLAGQRVFYGRIVNAELPQEITNRNNISFTFEEVL